MQKNLADYETVTFDEITHSLAIIDQTKLPNSIEILHLTEAEDVWDAIYHLKVRGAPAIGVAAAIGLYVILLRSKATDYNDFSREFHMTKDYLASSRPTAVNLFWALNRMEACLNKNARLPLSEIKVALEREAIAIREEDIWVCKKIGEYGMSLLKDGDGILTHCNGGRLATVKYGTATAPIYLAHENGYKLKVFADETRPLLQGARLTAFELKSAEIDVTLICDNMASTIMKNKWVDIVFTGCDRVAQNGDSANKIGTLGVAIMAKYFGLPFYICAPTSTIDMNMKTGLEIHIEERPSMEVTDLWYEKRMAPEEISVFNPAFDVTDGDLITGIITEYGIAYPPFTESLKAIFQKKEAMKNDIP